MERKITPTKQNVHHPYQTQCTEYLTMVGRIHKCFINGLKNFAVKSLTELLNERMNVLGPKESVSKSTFVDLLSQVWYKVLSETNIISEFRATEIFPTNRDNCNI